MWWRDLVGLVLSVGFFGIPALSANSTDDKYSENNYYRDTLVKNHPSHLNLEDFKFWSTIPAYQDIESQLLRASIEDPNFFKFFTLAYNSQSLQSSSPTHPRALLYGSDARLALTFNGSTFHSSHHSMELRQFRQQPKPHFEYRELKESDGTLTLSPANPPLCMQCHGTKPQPIWTDYSTWPHFYGEFNDVLYDPDDSSFQKGSDSQDIYYQRMSDHFREFLSIAPTHSRYRYLDRPEGNKWSPYSEDKTEYRFRNNLRLTHLLTPLKLQQIMGEITENKSCFRENSASYLYLALECETDSEEDQEALYDRIHQTFKKKYPFGEDVAPFSFYEKDYPDPSEIARLRLLALMGVDHREWSLQLDPKYYSYFNGRSYLKSYVLEKIYQRNAERLKLPHNFEEVAGGDLRFDPYYYTRSKESRHELEEEGTQNRAQVCKILSRENTGLDSCLAPPRFESTPLTVQMCLSCHAGQNSEAPVLELDRPRDLNPKMKQKIRSRILSKDPDLRMPPRRSLNLDEKRELLYFLDSANSVAGQPARDTAR